MSAEGCVLSEKPRMSEAFFVVFLMSGVGGSVLRQHRPIVCLHPICFWPTGIYK